MKKTLFKHKGELVGSCEGEMYITDIEKLREVIAMELEVTTDEIDTEFIDVKDTGLTCINAKGKLCYADIVETEILGSRCTVDMYNLSLRLFLGGVDEISNFII